MYHYNMPPKDAYIESSEGHAQTASKDAFWYVFALEDLAMCLKTSEHYGSI